MADALVGMPLTLTDRVVCGDARDLQRWAKDRLRWRPFIKYCENKNDL